jgi:DEAD/DEAH box helicase domain-containing protein
VADFLIMCVGAHLQGRELSAEECSGFQDVAVFLDGYQYHASPEYPRFLTDVQRRRAVNAAAPYLSWTLGWTDLDQFEAADSDALARAWQVNAKGRDVLLKLPKYRQADRRLLQAPNNLARLLWVLEQAMTRDGEGLRQACRLALAALTPDFGSCFLAPPAAAAYLRTGEMPPSAVPDREGEAFFPLGLPVPPGGAIRYRLLERLKDFKLLSQLEIDDLPEGYPREDWELFWRVYNLLQAEEPELRFELGAANLDPLDDEQADAAAPEGLLAYFDAAYHPLVRQLLEREIGFASEEGSFFLEENGQVAAEAVLGFPVAKVVLGALSEEDAAAFRAHGYAVRTLEDFELAEVARDGNADEHR